MQESTDVAFIHKINLLAKSNAIRKNLLDAQIQGLIDQRAQIDPDQESGKTLIEIYNKLIVASTIQNDDDYQLIEKNCQIANAENSENYPDFSTLYTQSRNATINLNVKLKELRAQACHLLEQFNTAPHLHTGSKVEDPRTQTLSSSLRSGEIPDWLTTDVLNKVRTRLKKLKKDTILQLLNKAHADFLELQGDKKAKAGERLYNIIHMPGFGFIEDPRDIYCTTKREEVVARRQIELEKIYEAQLEGTEGLTHEILQQHALLLTKMIQQEHEEEGLLLDPEEVGKMPVFCIDGPPGTGKTTVAKVIAHALDMGYYDVSMAGKEDTALIYGRGSTWEHPTPGLVAEAMLKSKRERVLILLDEAEKTKGKDLENALGQILEVNQQGYRDDYFDGALFDKRKAFFVLTTNNFALLPAHIQSRIRRVYLPGYDDPTKIKILKNMLVQDLGRLHASIQFTSNDPDDLKRKSTNPSAKEGSFKGFKVVSNEMSEDVIRYIVQHYVTEPGVREARDMLNKVMARAVSFAPMTVDCEFVSREDVLGKPDPNNLKIKLNNKKIDSENKLLYEVREKLIQVLDNLDNGADKDVNLNELASLINQLKGHRDQLLKIEELTLRLLENRKNNTPYQALQIQEHQEAVKNLNTWTQVLIHTAEGYLGHKESLSHQAVSLEQTNLQKEASSSPTKHSVYTQSHSARKKSKHKKRNNPHKNQANTNTDPRISPKVQPSPDSDTHKPEAAFSAAPTIAPLDNGIGAKVGKINFGYDIIKMLEKKSKKPAIIVNAGFTKHDLLSHFNNLCEQLVEKSQQYNTPELVDTVQQINDILEGEHLETKKEDILQAQLKEQFHNNTLLKNLLYKNPEKDKGNIIKRFQAKANTLAVYKDLQVKKEPANTLIISEGKISENPKPIVKVSHQKPIEGPNFVEIACLQTEPADRDLFVIINSARKISNDGRFTVIGCEAPNKPNPEAAMKLFLYGLSVGLTPRLEPSTREMIEKLHIDQTLFNIYQKYKNIVKVKLTNSQEILQDLEKYQSLKKAQKPTGS